MTRVLVLARICAITLIYHTICHAVSITMMPEYIPFTYDLGLKIMQIQSYPTDIMICCHGYGHNSAIVESIAHQHVFAGTLVGFNFPDHDISGDVDHAHTSFGTISELLPLLYLIKYYACDCAIPAVHLYGFSAGGGAVVNVLAVLNQQLYRDQLESIGITESDIRRMIQALSAGSIILDCPLKSVEEIISSWGFDLGLQVLADRYTQHGMNPLDTVLCLAGLTLKIFLYFENPDEILSNRDDALFIERLVSVNSGKTVVVVGKSGGHNVWHKELWEIYHT